MLRSILKSIFTSILSPSSSLVTLLGVLPDEILGSPPNSGLDSEGDRPEPGKTEPNEENEHSLDVDVWPEDLPPLQHLLTEAESLDPDEKLTLERLMHYRYAAVSLEMARDQEFSSFAEYDTPEIRNEQISEDVECIQDMVEYVARHQTRLAASASRSQSDAASEEKSVKKPVVDPVRAAQVELARGFQKIINDEAKKDRGEGTGKNRLARWMTSAKGGELDTGNDAPSGNAANAAAAATRSANSKLAERQKVYDNFPQLKLPLGNARISTISPIRTFTGPDHMEASSFGLGVVGFNVNDATDATKIVVCKILALYEQEGKKNAKHNDVKTSSNVCALSYIVAQTYENNGTNVFRPSTAHPRFPSTLRFEQLSPRTLLCTLQSPPTSVGNALRLAQSDYDFFQLVQSKILDVRDALKRLAPKRGG
ncbi:hypothetical protein GGX14DRAFT_580251 [Mycena pura]|uniref:Uncharacterized protein n=1 Tax=Mycena pura TaxID=153505 RepID=A0AAD6UPB1_9AGAR|nr:hypothetical protein GGX14DRAFT_580251 [Mycena pura]